MLLKVTPTSTIAGSMKVPSSKPETQRAIIAASLCEGVSKVYNDLRCLETETMKTACRSIGATIEDKDGYLEITGVGRNLQSNARVIDALGSGLVFRVLTALTCFSPSASVISGDKILCGRVMEPLFTALDQLGAKISCITEPGKGPVANWGHPLQGGECTIQGNISSQFITSVLLAAPMAAKPTKINITGEVLSISYIKQTIDTMTQCGIKLDVADDFSSITVYPGEYKATDHHIVGDFTSASYLVAAAAMFKGTTVLENMNSNSLQGERAIIEVVKALGVEVVFDDVNDNITLINKFDQIEGDFEFDASDYPNIVPTLAAIGTYVKGTFRVIGGSITRLHKSPRIKAMVSELQTMGVDITAILKDGDVYDGFEIKGAGSYEGDVELSSWGDHRIFMSLFVASLRCKNPNFLDGYNDVSCSFPGFFDEFSRAQVQFEEVEEMDDEAKRA